MPNINATASNQLNLTAIGNFTANKNLTFEVNGTSMTVADLGATTTTAATAIAAAIQSESALASLTVTDGANGTLTLANSTGADISFEIVSSDDPDITFTLKGELEDGTDGTARVLDIANAAQHAVTATGALSYTTPLAETTAITVNSSGAIYGGAATATMATTSTTISTVDISTSAGAQSAISVIDAALATVSSDRADLGAIQNRFESIVSNLSTNAENQSAARSRIMDADFAVETASLTRGQILQQAGIAVLAQANAAPQNVLALLQ